MRKRRSSESHPLDLLRYRSNLLGADLRITNFGGGNTSSKFDLTDPLTGQPQRVMAVKGSGGDLRSITNAGFAILYMDKLNSLIPRYRGEALEDEMVAFYPLCAFGENRVAASIDTPLHAFLPFAHVDHLHPDWAIALAASANGERKMQEFNTKYGRKIIWVPWQRPGFELALMLKRAVEATPGCDGLILGGHGLFTWGDTQKACYLNSIRTIDEMGEFIQEHAARRGQAALRRRGGHRDGAGSSSGRRRDPAVSARRRVVEPARHRARRRFRRRPDVCQLAVGRRSLPDGHELSRSFPSHPDLADVHPVGSGEGGRRAAQQAHRRARGNYRKDYAEYDNACADKSSSRSCATRIHRWSSFPASACSGSARTSARRASRPSSSSTPFT